MLWRINRSLSKRSTYASMVYSRASRMCGRLNSSTAIPSGTVHMDCQITDIFYVEDQDSDTSKVYVLVVQDEDTDIYQGDFRPESGSGILLETPHFRYKAQIRLRPGLLLRGDKVTTALLDPDFPRWGLEAGIIEKKQLAGRPTLPDVQLASDKARWT